MVRTRQLDIKRFPELQWFARNVAFVRQSLGLSQSGFAQLCGLTQPYISALETLQANPTLEVMSAIAKATGISVSEFTDEDAPELPT